MDNFDYSMLDGADILTGSDKNFPIKIKENHKSLIAAFDNGIVLVSTGNSESEITRMVISSMFEIENTTSFREIIEITPNSLKEVYERYDKGADTGDDEMLARRRKLKQIIADAVKSRASDIHIYNYERHADVQYRVFNVLSVKETLTTEEAGGLIEAAFAVSEGQLGSSPNFIRQGALTPVSGLLPRGVSMLRLQYVPTSFGGAVVWRISYGSDPRVVNLADLGYSQNQIDEISIMKRRTSGMNILAGRVSSGKTTTLQRVVNGIYLENNGEGSIYTIEDPIEIKLIAGAQFNAIPQPDLQAGDSSKKIDGFQAGIATALRFDINVGVLGEIRSPAVAGQAVQLALTGHALWTTVHAGSALQILERLNDLSIPKFRLADPELIRGLIYQRLLGKICPNCRITFNEGVQKKKITESLARQSIRLFNIPARELYLRGPGCPNCSDGVVGRTVVAEVIRPDENLLELFAKEPTQMPLREYWLRPKEENGFGGLPVLHQALVKTAAGLCDVNETEKEVDLVSEYVRKYEHLIPKLKSDITEMRESLKEVAKK